jgi:hypothetical protein
MSARAIAAGLLMAFASLALACAAEAQEHCDSGQPVVMDSPLYFGGIWVREGGSGAVVVSLRSGVTSVGDVMTDGRGEIGRMTVCGDAGSRFYLTIAPRQTSGADAHALSAQRVRDFEVQATGAVVEHDGENSWLITLGARGRGALTVGGTLVMLPFASRGTVVQTFIVSIIAVKGSTR